MKKFSKQLCISMALALSLLVSSAAAHDKDHGNGKGRDKHADHDKDRDHDRDKDREQHGPSSRPAGWDKGKKTGWGNCDVPPGQAKKVGCNPSSSARTTHHVDHDKRVRRDERRDSIANHRTADRRTADARRDAHRDTRRDIKPVPTANNQPATTKGGSRIEHPRTEALRK